MGWFKEVETPNLDVSTTLYAKNVLFRIYYSVFVSGAANSTAASL
jgi:hypothetical protein